MTTIVRSVTLTQDNNGDQSFGYRQRIATLASGSLGQVRVSFTTKATSCIIANASIGIAAGANSTTTATPVELLFSGGHGFTLGANSTIVSDWLTFSFLSTDSLVIITDQSASGLGGSAFDTGFGANDIWWAKAATASYNVITEPGSPLVVAANRIELVSLIETQAGADAGIAPHSVRPTRRSPRFFPGARGPRRYRQVAIPPPKAWDSGPITLAGAGSVTSIIDCLNKITFAGAGSLGPVSPTTFDPATLSPATGGQVLSGANLIATATANSNIAYGTARHAFGKKYCEFVYTGAAFTGGGWTFFIQKTRAAYPAGFILAHDGTTWYSDGGTPSATLTWSAQPALGDVIVAAIDFDLGKAWTKSTSSLNWNNDPTADPVAGTGGQDFSAQVGDGVPWYIGIDSGQGGQVCTVNFGATPYKFTPPVGYTNWGTGVDATVLNAVTLAGAGSLVCNATIPSGGPTTWQGAALLAGTGRFGDQIVSESAAFAGTGRFGDQIVSESATFAGTGRFGDQIVSEFATFAGTGRFGDQIVPESATFAGAGGLRVDARQIMAASALLAGTGRFGDQIVSEFATFAGTGRFGDQVVSESALLAGAGGLRVPAILYEQAAALLAGAGGLRADIAVLNAVTLAGTGGLRVDAHTVTTGAALLAGTGRFGDQVVSEFAIFAGTGRFGDQIVPESATFAGTGGLGATATGGTSGPQAWSGAALLAGTGGLTVSAILWEQASALFAGAGVLVVNAQTRTTGAALFAGAGNLQVNAQTRTTGAALFAGAGSLQVNAQTVTSGAALFAGTGSLQVNGGVFKPASALLSGSGTLRADAHTFTTGQAVFAGSSGLSAPAVLREAIAPVLAGSGGMSSPGTLFFAAGAAKLTGVGVISGDAVLSDIAKKLVPFAIPIVGRQLSPASVKGTASEPQEGNSNPSPGFEV